MSHEHKLEFVSEENGISIWRCIDKFTEYFAGHWWIYQCPHIEIQMEDSI